MITYVLDANTVSYLIRGEGKAGANFQKKIVLEKNFYAIPYVVVYEVRRWLEDKPTKQMLLFSSQFSDLFGIVATKADIEPAVWNIAVEIYIDLKQKGQLIGDADILIAAYCMSKNYTLVTRNERDFKRVSGLKFINWFE